MKYIEKLFAAAFQMFATVFTAIGITKLYEYSPQPNGGPTEIGICLVVGAMLFILSKMTIKHMSITDPKPSEAAPTQADPAELFEAIVRLSLADGKPAVRFKKGMELIRAHVAASVAERDKRIAELEKARYQAQDEASDLYCGVQEALAFMQSVGTEDPDDVEEMARIEQLSGKLSAKLARSLRSAREASFLEKELAASRARAEVLEKALEECFGKLERLAEGAYGEKGPPERVMNILAQARRALADNGAAPQPLPNRGTT